MPWTLLLAAGCLSGPAAAQVSVRGQVFLPIGQPITEVTEFQLESDDPRRPTDTMWTDIRGRFWMQGLSPNTTFRIVIRGDGKRYRTTIFSFLPSAQSYVPVHLLPLEVTKVKTGATVAVEALRGPAEEAYNKARRAVKQNKTGEAKKLLQRAIELNPGYLEAYNDLAVLYMNEKNYPGAEELLRKALQKDPGAAVPLLNLGSAFNHQGRYRDAIAPLRKALQGQPRWHNAEAQLGIALLETDQVEAARPCLESGTGAEGTDQVYAFLYLGKLYATTGEFSHALAAWQKYLQLDPKSPNADKIRQIMEQIPPHTTATQGPLAKATGVCQ